jgi:NAD(P)-dependent dehydrogenase (short-subunit alcohol dehydrogenase family)
MLSGKSVVISGASGGLGRGVVERAKELGAKVIPIDVVAPEGGIGLDFTDTSATIAALSGLGPIDAYFHLIGGFGMGPTGYDADPSLWDKMFKMNVLTLQNAVRGVVPGMIAAGHGSIVTIGAISALKGSANMSAYIAAKSAVMRLTESLSAELKGQGINVNSVLPSIIDTPTNRGDMPDADFSKWVSPKDLANVICFLGSDQAKAVHGALVPVANLS